MVTNHSEENPVDWLIREIADFVAISPLNTLGLPGGESPVNHTSPRPMRASLIQHRKPGP
jgi:hypothetical protein